MWHAEFLPPGGKERGPRLDPAKKGLARREELARFLVEHERFPKALVNRMWGLFFGRGFVNPIDDFNDNNQPSNHELPTSSTPRLPCPRSSTSEATRSSITTTTVAAAGVAAGVGAVAAGVAGGVGAVAAAGVVGGVAAVPAAAVAAGVLGVVAAVAGGA